MSHLALARKYRPRTFDEIVGQQQVVRTLVNALDAGRTAHAYLFAGVRGTGKTTAARILARALNCASGEKPTSRPCGECAPCVEMLAGSDLDLHEIDAASHTGVDKVRELIEGMRYAPVRDRYKVFIVDEVHMLSNAAFNALLKTLEEPPPYVVFILATTELHKIPATILSRCQQFPFRRLDTVEIAERLASVCDSEKVPAERAALDLVAEAGGGSMRDALSILDQAIVFGGGKVDLAEVEPMLGRIDRRAGSRLLEVALGGSAKDVVLAVKEVGDSGSDLRTAYRELVRGARALMLLRAAPDLPDLVFTAEERAKADRLVAERSYEELLRLYDHLLREDGFVRRADDPRLAVELVLLRARELPRLRPIEEIVKSLRSGAAAPGLPAAPAPPPAPAPRASDEPRILPAPSRGALALVPAPEPPPSFADLPPDLDDDEPAEPPRFVAISAVPPLPPPPAPPAAPDGSEEKLLERLATEHPRISGGLAAARTISFVDDRLEVRFGPAHSAIRAQVEGEQSRRNLERVASEVAGFPVRLDVDVVLPADGDLTELAADVSREDLERDRLKRKIQEDPLVQRALEVFRGELVDWGPASATSDRKAS